MSKVPNSRVVVGLPMTGGINRFNSMQDIRDDEAVTLKNLFPEEVGELQTRPAMEIQGAASLPVDGFPIAMQFLPVNAPAAFVIHSRKATEHTHMSAYEEAGGNVGPLATADLGVNTQYVPAFIAYQGRAYGFGGLGASSVGKILQRTSGGGVEIADFIFSSSGNETLRPTAVGVFRERFVFMNFGPGYESTIVFADPFQPTVIGANALASNGRNFPVSPDDGDRIVAGVELLQTGTTVLQATFLVLKEFSAYLLTGDALTSTEVYGTDPDTIAINKMPVNCGCSAPATVCTTPFGVIWAGPDDVWFFPEGQLPYRVGTKIRPALEATPANVRYRWHAAYDRGFYKLAVFTDGAGPTDDDACGEQYWLDLRSGPPRNWQEAKWFGPEIHTFNKGLGSTSVLGTHCLAIDTRPIGNRALWSAGGTGDDTIHFMTFTGDSEQDSTNQGVVVAGVDTPIEVEVLTKEMKTIVQGDKLVADSIMEKGLHGIELEIHVNRPALLGWKWILNSGRSVGAEQTALVAPPSGLVLDVDVLDTAVLSDESALLGLDPAPTRVVGNALQFRLYNKPGYYIDATNDLLSIDVDVPATVRFVVSVPHGYYTNLVALCAAIQLALNTQLGVFSRSVTIGAGSNQVIITHNQTDDLAFSTTACAPANRTKVAVLANLLGFTDWTGVGYAGTVIGGTTKVPSRLAQTWEIPNGLILHLYTIPRRTL